MRYVSMVGCESDLNTDCWLIVLIGGEDLGLLCRHSSVLVDDFSH